MTTAQISLESAKNLSIMSGMSTMTGLLNALENKYEKIYFYEKGFSLNVDKNKICAFTFTFDDGMIPMLKCEVTCNYHPEDAKSLTDFIPVTARGDIDAQYITNTQAFFIDAVTHLIEKLVVIVDDEIEAMKEEDAEISAMLGEDDDDEDEDEDD